jgi:DnaK suppressor protein
VFNFAADKKVAKAATLSASREAAMSELRLKRLTVESDTHLARIEAALDRLDCGTYGYCEVCLEPIAINRLEHDPTARICGTCTSKH